VSVRHKGRSGEVVGDKRTMAGSWVIVGQRGTVHGCSPALAFMHANPALIGMIGAGIT
jgi:hypothetical protein